MADNTKIEWTQATWNPIRAITRRDDGSERKGWHCEHVSEGCRNCYAESFNKRLGTGFDYKPGHLSGDVEVYLDEKMLTQPLRWKKARQIFVCSMTDLFADFVTDEMRDRIFAVMALCPQHTFQVLAKRSARMREYCNDQGAIDRIDCFMDELINERVDSLNRRSDDLRATAPCMSDFSEDWPLPNVWLGVSVENQAAADERIPDLLATPAAIRWISAEPLLGPVDLTQSIYRGDGGITMKGFLRDKAEADDFHYWGTKIDWVVAGGESGKGARPMHPDWARSLRDQCAAAGTPFFFKQWGDWALVAFNKPPNGYDNEVYQSMVTNKTHVFDDHVLMIKIPKKAAGRLLDGVLHDGMPT